MKQGKGREWEMVWAGVGLMVIGCLLLWVRPGMFGLPGWLYWCVTGALCVAELAQVYRVSRDFFRGKK